MEALTTDDGSQLADAKVISLDRQEKRLLSASFLAQLASGLSLFVLITLGFLVATARLGGVVVLLLVFVLFFVWSCAIAYMWRAAILLISLTVCLAITALAVATDNEYFQTMNLLDYMEFMFRVAFISPVLIFSMFLVCRILLDGCRLAATPANLREFFIAGDPRSRGAGYMFAATLGIHPICRWIPGGGRRLIAAGLFVLAATASGFTIAVVMSSLLLSGGLIAAFISGSVFAAITALLRLLARRFARVSAENLIQVDQRAPILFLRSFKDDQIRLDRPKRGVVRGLLGEPLRPTLDHILLEEFTPLGPVVAIGVPGAPAPFGVSRTYADDGEWRDVVAKLARDASAVVIVLDDTEGVQWELSHIVDHGHLPKTLCLVPPRFAKRSEDAAQIVRRALIDNKCVLTEPLTEPCIGWYRTSHDEMVLMVSPRPNQASYICAARQFRQRDLG
jgi:hypothetical protein